MQGESKISRFFSGVNQENQKARIEVERFSLDLPQAIKKYRECFLEVLPVCVWGEGREVGDLFVGSWNL